MRHRKTALVVLAGLAATVVALPFAGINPLGLLACVYGFGGGWVLNIGGVAIGVVLGLQVDRTLESRRLRDRLPKTTQHQAQTNDRR